MRIDGMTGNISDNSWNNPPESATVSICDHCGERIEEGEETEYNRFNLCPDCYAEQMEYDNAKE
jgi:formylmethanofuran dehydrogenase subunit E